MQIYEFEVMFYLMSLTIIIMKHSETKDQINQPRRSHVQQYHNDKTLNEKSNKMNISTDMKTTIRTSKDEASPGIGTNKYQSFTKFPPIKKGIQDQKEEFSKNLIRKPSEKEKQLDALGIKDNGVTKQVIKKKNNPRKTPTSHPNAQMISRFRIYKGFLDLINVSNNISITSERLEIGRKYLVYFGKGNNSALVKNIIKSRPWWSITQDPEDSNINFVWTQIRQNDVLEKCRQLKNDDFDDITYQLKNSEKQPEMPCSQDEDMGKSTIRSRTFSRSHSVNKESLNYSTKFIKRNSSRPKQPTTSKVIPTNIKEGVQFEKQRTQNKKQLVNPKVWMNYQNLRKIFCQKDMKSLKSISAILQEGGAKALTRNKIKVYQGCTTFMLHNHLQNNWNLSNKKALFVNMKSYYQAKKINPFQYIPVTFHVESLQSKEFHQFVQYYNSKSQPQNQNKKQGVGKSKPKRRNIWLVKPGQNTNRGTGIMVSQSLEQIKQIITKETVDSQGRQRTHILQQYILPFLYNKRKFDIRSYILLTSVNGVNKGYWFQQGYIRTACKQFNFKNLSNKFIHLTNDAVQKKCEEYGKFQPGNKISYSEFQRYLDTNQPKLKFWSQAYPQMKKLATDAIKAVHTKINPDKKQFSFQIFGLDFMIDENFKVWLIEANTNPCLELSCPLLGRIIPSMLENAFRIAVDPVFPPPGQAYLLNLPRTFVPENILEVNRFELVFDEIEEGKELKSILTNTPNVDIYDIVQEEEEYDQGQKNAEIYKSDDILELE